MALALQNNCKQYSLLLTLSPVWSFNLDLEHACRCIFICSQPSVSPITSTYSTVTSTHSFAILPLRNECYWILHCERCRDRDRQNCLAAKQWWPEVTNQHSIGKQHSEVMRGARDIHSPQIRDWAVSSYWDGPQIEVFNNSVTVSKAHWSKTH